MTTIVRIAGQMDKSLLCSPAEHDYFLVVAGELGREVLACRKCGGILPVTQYTKEPDEAI
jgi:hypothetical protein